MIAVRAHQHHPPLGIADDRGEARAVARDLDTAKSRFGFFGEPDRVGFILDPRIGAEPHLADQPGNEQDDDRSEEHTSELQSLMRISYAVFCLKQKKKHTTTTPT